MTPRRHAWGEKVTRHLARRGVARDSREHTQPATESVSRSPAAPQRQSAPLTRELLDSIETDTVGGLRDRALIGVLVYSFARIGAALALKVDDYFPEGKHWKLRLHEKGGKEHVVPVHHTLEQYLDAYLDAARIREHSDGLLFRTLSFAELNQALRYPWIEQIETRSGLSVETLRWFEELVHHLRSDIPIVTDNYILAMLLRGYFHQGPSMEFPQSKTLQPLFAPSTAALRATFADLNGLVRWP